MRATVLIVDDHEVFRDAACALLRSEGYDVVGVAIDGATAIAQAARLRPQIVLLDVHLPDSDGFAIARRLAAMSDPPRVVLTSARDVGDDGPRLSAARVRGFIAKRELSGARLASLVG
jgi:DNA-binding NarL/FixJ family response regulator